EQHHAATHQRLRVHPGAMITTATPSRQRARVAHHDPDTCLVITTEDLQLTVSAIEPGVTYVDRR
ncbi:MAG TPA: hypothetical protein VIJ00_19830, partial [Nakamurella sp.]